MLSDIYGGNLAWGRHFYVRIVNAVVNHFLVAMHFGAGRYVDMNDGLVFVFHNFWREVHRRRDNLRVSNHFNKVFDDIRCRVRGNAANGAVILNAEEDISTVTVQKRAYGFIGVRLDAVRTPFEFYRDGFADGEDIA